MRRSYRRFTLASLFLVALLGGCRKLPPRNASNICSVFLQYPTWYWAAKQSQRDWGVSIPIQMAILHQESRFTANALPARTKLFWIIPWTRPSSSFGYAQALKSTWKNYQKNRGHRRLRDKFSDATDFIGWYAQMAHDRAGIPKEDAYRLYLAYHEGVGGYMRGTFQRKVWLQHVARKVARRAGLFTRQLTACEPHLARKPWYRFW